MLTKLDYTVSQTLLQEAASNSLLEEGKTTINKPTGDFFYDPWKIKDEYKDTVWESIIKTLPIDIGEARIINLYPATCYQAHSDIDDRYHLNLSGEECYLIDLNNNCLHKLITDGYWYEMNAGKLHSAGNFGRLHRTQLVVRKLLISAELLDPVTVRITSSGISNDSARFLFDQTISSWLNYANKEKLISNFKFNQTNVEFSIERQQLMHLQNILINNFKLEVL